MTNNNVQLLCNIEHRHLKIDTTNYNGVEYQVNAALISISELSTLVHEYPVFITKSPNSGQFQLSAILGLEPGQNLFVHNGDWRATYIPLDMLRRPFTLLLDEKSKDELGHIAIDTSSVRVNQNKGESLFDELGRNTEFTDKISEIFANLSRNMQMTANILNMANQLGLIEAVNIDIELSDNNKKQLTGLYAFNKEKISELTGHDLEQCHKSGLLQVCHLILSSGLHLQKLINWAEK